MKTKRGKLVVFLFLITMSFLGGCGSTKKEDDNNAEQIGEEKESELEEDTLTDYEIEELESDTDEVNASAKLIESGIEEDIMPNEDYSIKDWSDYEVKESSADDFGWLPENMADLPVVPADSEDLIDSKEILGTWKVCLIESTQDNKTGSEDYINASFQDQGDKIQIVFKGEGDWNEKSFTGVWDSERHCFTADSDDALFSVDRVWLTNNKEFAYGDIIWMNGRYQVMYMVRP